MRFGIWTSQSVYSFYINGVIAVFCLFAFINAARKYSRTDIDAWFVVIIVAIGWPILLPWTVYWRWMRESVRIK